MKKVILLIFVLFLAFFSIPNNIWASELIYDYTYTWNEIDDVNFVYTVNDFIINSNGDQYILGHYSGTVDFDLSAGTDIKTSTNWNDTFLTKINADGSYGYTYTFVAKKAYMVIDGLDNIYLFNSFSGTVDFDPTAGVDNKTSNGLDDLALTKINADGSYGYTYTMGGTGTESSRYLINDSDNNLYLLGTFRNTVDFDPTGGIDNKTSNGLDDIFMTKINADGSYGYTHTFGGTSSDIGLSLTLNPSNDIFITGFFNGTADFDPTAGVDNKVSNGGRDIFFTKINADGTYGYTHTFGSASWDEGLDIISDSFGNIYMTGLFYGTIDFDPTAGVDNKVSAGSSDTFLFKINNDDSYGGTLTFGSTSSDKGLKLGIDNNNNLFMVTTFRGTVDFDPTIGTDFKTNVGSEGLSLTRINADDSYSYTYVFDGIDGFSSAWAHNLKIFEDNNGNKAIYVLGQFYGSVDFDPTVGNDVRIDPSWAGKGFLTKMTELNPNIAPVALNVQISGIPNLNQELVGSYTYLDDDGDLEGVSVYRWLRDDIAIPGETSITYTTALQDVGTTLKFEVTPVAQTGISPGLAVVSNGILIVASAPSIITNSASSIERETAILNGEITSNGGENATVRGFEYGLTDNYGSTITENGLFDIGIFSADISGLDCGKEYHYRAYAENNSGISYGLDQVFTTTQCPPPPSSSSGSYIINPIINPINTIIPVIDNNITPTYTFSPADDTPTPGPILDLTLSVDQETEDDSPFDLKEEEIPQEEQEEIPLGNKEEISQEEKEEENLIKSNNTRTSYPFVNKILSVTVGAFGLLAGIKLILLDMVFFRPLSFSEIPLSPTRLWGLFFRNRKRNKNPWGTVYDSVTKQPLDPVYVTLEDLNGEEVANCITDLDGRYGFLIPPGIYRINVNKTHYQFPSVKLMGKSKDVLYTELYFGETVEVKKGGDVIIKNIPMDSTGFDWNEFAKRDRKIMKYFSKKDIWLSHIFYIIFISGLIFSTIAVILSSSIYNYIILGLYFIMFVLRLTSFRPKPTGQIKEDTGPLSFGIIHIYQTKTNQKIAKKVTDISGRYYCLLNNDNYYVKIDKKTGEDEYTEVYTSESFEVKKGYLDREFMI